MQALENGFAVRCERIPTQYRAGHCQDAGHQGRQQHWGYPHIAVFRFRGLDSPSRKTKLGIRKK